MMWPTRHCRWCLFFLPPRVHATPAHPIHSHESRPTCLITPPHHTSQHAAFWIPDPLRTAATKAHLCIVELPGSCATRLKGRTQLHLRLALRRAPRVHSLLLSALCLALLLYHTKRGASTLTQGYDTVICLCSRAYGRHLCTCVSSERSASLIPFLRP